MSDPEADRAAILTVVRAETEAWLRRDFEALAGHWVQSPQTRRLRAFASLGIRADEGWAAIGAQIKGHMQRFPTRYALDDRTQLENVNVVLGGDMAWVSYDEIGTDEGDDFSLAGARRILKILHRIDESWRIGCMVLMENAVGYATCPLVEVDAATGIVWMNALAEARLRDHPGLVAAAGRLRPRRRDREPALREAVRWAYDQLGSQAPLNVMPKQACAVALGEDDAAAPLFCWVFLEDARVLVSFDDTERVGHRVALAAEVYGLSPAQARLGRLLVDGHDLAAAAGLLGVSVNTLRTQLQRIFDKTGVRSQAALVSALLSAEPPLR